MPDELEIEMESELPDYDPEIGQVLYTWKYEQYQKGHRGKTWYTIAGLLVVALLLYALFTQNFTFAFLILLVSFLYFVLEWREPGAVRVKVTDIGIMIGTAFYRYADFDAFWILYQPPVVKNLYLRLKGSRTPRYSLSLGDTDPVALRDVLLSFLPEDLTQEIMPIAESWGKVFKL